MTDGTAADDELLVENLEGIDIRAFGGNDVLTFRGELTDILARGGAGNDIFAYFAYTPNPDNGVALRGGAGLDTLVAGNGLSTIDDVDFAGFEILEIGQEIESFNIPIDLSLDTIEQLSGLTIRGEALNIFLQSQNDLVAPLRFSMHLETNFVFGAGEDLSSDGVNIDLRGLSRATADMRVSVNGFGNATVFGSDGSDSLTLQTSADFGVLRGLGGNDTLASSVNGARLFGGEGNDSFGLFEHEAADITPTVARGGTGRDVFFVDADNARIFGGRGQDTVVFRSTVEDVTVSTGGERAESVVFTSTSRAFADIDATNVVMRDAVQSTFLETEGAVTLLGDEIPNYGRFIVGSSQASNLPGGRAEADFAQLIIENAGGQVFDLDLRVSQDRDFFLKLKSNPNEDVTADLSGTRFTDGSVISITGGRGNDTIHATNADDLLHGQQGSDDLNGGRGDDTLIDGGGRDLLTGGRGSDTFRMSEDGRRDVIQDFQDGRDVIDLSAFDLDSFDEISFRDVEGGVRLTIRDDTTVIHAGDDRLSSSDFTLQDFIF